MHIVFSNGETVDLILNQTPVARLYQKIYKHLQHIAIPFRDWDSPYYYRNCSLPQLVDKMIMFAEKLNVEIHRESCLAQDQDYFNALHILYENNSNNGLDWVDFHRHLHMCEKNYNAKSMMQKTLKIDYKEKAGLLEKPFDHHWLNYATSTVLAGEAFICWQELGKTPYTYWSNKEPDNIMRMQQVMRPWTKMTFSIFIALEDINMQKDPIELAEFESWWSQYSQQMCNYWNIVSWTLDDMFKCLVIGQVPNIEMVIKLLENNTRPVRVIL